MPVKTEGGNIIPSSKIGIMAERLLKPDQIPLIEKLAENIHSGSIQRRARILLLYNSGKEVKEIASTVGTAPSTVRYWRREFEKRGMDIFAAGPERGGFEKPVEGPVDGGIPSIPVIQPEPQKPPPIRRRYPRVRKNPGIKPDDSMTEAGRKILRYHFAHMLNHEKGTRLGTDIEELHDMRVATRRLRAAFDIFRPYFRPKVIKHHLKGLRATGRALGRVRDLDVFIEKASHYLETLPKVERPGLEPLLSTWEQRRALERKKLLSHLDSESYQQFKRDFNDFTAAPVAVARPSSGISPQPDLVRHVVPVLVYTNLAAIRAYEAILSNSTIEQLHALRIEFKKFRYTLEFFREVLGSQSREVINDLKVLQDHLGNLNDANVACQILRDYLDDWEDRQVLLPLYERQNPELVVAYLAAKHAERHKLMVTFPEAWAHFNRLEFLQNVSLSVAKL